ncbi:hypothetical protein Z948_697 [Sulfitobacter donghicola DSW-25 = KCTC 12864 = JCM 14565]|nr:hypothetical protein Z948_697 [Sulfitobacter donghicola DSW-25 = KCTC 12864 = JCM 14565]
MESGLSSLSPEDDTAAIQPSAQGGIYAVDGVGVNGGFAQSWSKDKVCAA